jgi:DNA-binding GntR family transcriptional regulator
VSVRQMINKSNLCEDVKDVLKNRIINKDLNPGDKLHLNSLSRELGVSGTPIREALHKLEREGFLKNVPHRGFFIKEITAKDLIEIFQLREALEVLAIRLASPLFVEKDIKKMEELLEKSKIAFKNNDKKVFIDFDRAMHSLIIEKSGNQRLCDIIGNLSDFVHALRIRKIKGLEGNERVHLAIQEHEALLEAIKEKDIEKASMATATHLKNSLEYYLKHLSELSQTEATF